jgi:hypothetical protein
MGVVFSVGNGMSDMLCAFDGVNDEHEVADALATVRAQVTIPTCSRQAHEADILQLFEL